MHDGKIVEEGTADQVCESPRDDYTKKLLAAVPIPDPRESRRPARSVRRREPPARAADKAAAGADPQRAARGRGVGLRAEARRLPRDRLRRRRRGLHPVAAAAKRSPATSRSSASRPGATCSTASWSIRDDDGNLEFDALQSRIHPAESRINDALRGDPGQLHRLRPARRGRRVAARGAARRAPRAARGARRRGRPRAHAADPRHRPGRASGCEHRGRRWRSSSTPPTYPASAKGWRR